jgi:hypothetical protein
MASVITNTAKNNVFTVLHLKLVSLTFVIVMSGRENTPKHEFLEKLKTKNAYITTKIDEDKHANLEFLK